MDFITIATNASAEDQGDLSVALGDGNCTAVDNDKALISGNSAGYGTAVNIYTFSVSSGGGSDTGSDLSVVRATAGGLSGS